MNKIEIKVGDYKIQYRFFVTTAPQSYDHHNTWEIWRYNKKDKVIRVVGIPYVNDKVIWHQTERYHSGNHMCEEIEGEFYETLEEYLFNLIVHPDRIDENDIGYHIKPFMYGNY